MEIKVNAPAKVNLAVDVLGRRPDGYHSVSLVLQAISLSDTITITTTDTKEITVTCNDSNVPTDKTNIVYKSAERFLDILRLRMKVSILIFTRLYLHKQVLVVVAQMVLPP